MLELLEQAEPHMRAKQCKWDFCLKGEDEHPACRAIHIWLHALDTIRSEFMAEARLRGIGSERLREALDALDDQRTRAELTDRIAELNERFPHG